MPRRLRDWASRLRAELAALLRAARDAETPWPVRVLALLVVAYAVSPIDLIPDPIPVLGYLDDLVLLPIGILLVRRLIPAAALARGRAASAAGDPVRPVSRRVAVLVVLTTWLLPAVAALVAWRLA